MTAAHRRAPAGRAGRVLGAVAATGVVAFAVSGCGAKTPAANSAAATARTQTTGGTQQGTPEFRQPAPAKAGVDGRYAPDPLRPPGKPGQVLVEDGPFVSRLKLSDLALRPQERPGVSGTIKTGVEDSELLGFDLEADFYDQQGRLVGKGTRHYGEGPSLSGEPQRFSVRSEKPAPGAVAVLVAVLNFAND